METKRKVGLGFILLCIVVPVIPMAICIKRSIDGDDGNGVLVTILGLWAMLWLYVVIGSALDTKQIDHADEIPQINVDIKPEVEVFADGAVQFLIETNLPEKTILMVTVKNEDGYCGQDKAEVYSNGLAIAGEFTNNGEPLKGKYMVSISMSIPRLQDEAVQKVVGSSGEYITGKFVQVDDITGDNWVSADFEFDF